MPRSNFRRLAVSAATVAVAGLAFIGPAGASGANVSGPYDPTNVGAPSGNGVATTQPCAACAGTILNNANGPHLINPADFKNPPGQVDNLHDNGYECDGNQGIGQTNPAHTGCDTSSGSN